MSISSRPAMRLLSTRLAQLQRVSPASKLCATQIRHASRYSAPTRRSYTAAPAQESYFVNPSGEDLDLRHPMDPPRNPLDARAVSEAAEEKRQYHLRRMRFAGMGLLLSLAGLGTVVYNLDLDDMDQSQEEFARKNGKLQMDASSEANARFHGKEVQIIGAGEGKASRLSLSRLARAAFHTSLGQSTCLLLRRRTQMLLLLLCPVLLQR
jgi:hypothetical protein